MAARRADGGPDITELLRQWSDGDDEALAHLVGRVYGDFRKMAAAQLRGERQGHTLEPTALVHELFFKLQELDHMVWQNRQQFFATAARMMRRLLVDHARERNAGKRRGIKVTLHEGLVAPEGPRVELVELDAALERLETAYPREARVVTLRYFLGMTNEEAAEALEVSLVTVKRDWTFARRWLLRELRAKGA